MVDGFPVYISIETAALRAPDMTRDNTFELFGPLATAIRELLFLEWDPCRINHAPESADVYDDYIPAIHRLAKDRHSSRDGEDIEHIAAYLNFVVRNYVGEMPDKALNHEVAAKIFALAEAARSRHAAGAGGTLATSRPGEFRFAQHGERAANSAACEGAG